MQMILLLSPPLISSIATRIRAVMRNRRLTGLSRLNGRSGHGLQCARAHRHTLQTVDYHSDIKVLVVQLLDL